MATTKATPGWHASVTASPGFARVRPLPSSSIKNAFNAVEISRLPDGRTIMHASIRIGDSTVMLPTKMPEYGALGPKALKVLRSQSTSTWTMSTQFTARRSVPEQRAHAGRRYVSGVTDMARSRTRSATVGQSHTRA